MFAQGIGFEVLRFLKMLISRKTEADLETYGQREWLLRILVAKQ